MNYYIDFVTTYPLISAMIQFALLGTFGDTIAFWFRRGKVFSPYTVKTFFYKIVEWGFLGLLIKYAFAGFKGFIDALIAGNYLPALDGIGKAFATSVAINLQFGILLVLLHRWLDNLIAGEGNNWKNIEKSLFSLIWFWIPAHTITFSLPKDFQIGLAALWSVALGFILGFYSRKAVRK
jgi:hypothetical protein